MDQNSEKNKERVNRIENIFINLRRTIFNNNARQYRVLPSATMSLVRILADYYSDAKTPISVGGLAARSELSPSAISQHLDIIEERHGIIKRQPSKTDKRVIEIIPTKHGRIMFDQIIENRQYSHLLQDLIDHLGPDDSDELLRLLERVDEFINNRNKKLS